MSLTAMNRRLIAFAALLAACLLLPGIAALPVSAAPPASPAKSPKTVVRWVLSLDGTQLGQFKSLSGLNQQPSAVGGPGGASAGQGLKKLSGQTKVGVITLKRGMVTSQTLWKWRQDVNAGKTSARRNSALIGYDSQGNRVIQYSLKNAWPSNYKGPTLTANGNAIAIEHVKISFEGLTLVPLQ